MDFNKDLVRIKIKEMPTKLVEKAMQNIENNTVTAIHLKK
jgi:hypothetical protein